MRFDIAYCKEYITMKKQVKGASLRSHWKIKTTASLHAYFLDSLCTISIVYGLSILKIVNMDN